jgi:ComF family protein
VLFSQLAGRKRTTRTRTQLLNAGSDNPAMLDTLFQDALEFIFPGRCAACDGACRGGATFCSICDISVLPVAAACARCALPTPRPVARCLGCMTRLPEFAAAWAPFEFGGAVALAVRRLKWQGRPELGRLLVRAIPPPILTAAFSDAELVVPVPLHPRRLREREFNQAAVLALTARSRLPRIPGGPHRPRFSARALARVRSTAPQTDLTVAERRVNVKGAFHAEPRLVAGRRILLVDDVMTSGATACSCAAALLEAGAVAVAVLTVARAVP